MDAIIQFFEGIASAVTGFFSFLFSLVGDLVYLVELTGKMLAQIPLFLSWFPPQILAVVVTGISIAVLYKILGRD